MRRQKRSILLVLREDNNTVVLVKHGVRTGYVLDKELWKIHMQRRGKTGSGARPEGIPGVRRDVTR